jgi:hypothetical protein
VLLLQPRERQMSAGQSIGLSLFCWWVKISSSFPPWTRRHYVAPKHLQLPVSFPGWLQPQLVFSHSVAWSSPHEPTVSPYIMTRSHYSLSCSTQQAVCLCYVTFTVAHLNIASCVFVFGHSHDGTHEHSCSHPAPLSAATPLVIIDYVVSCRRFGTWYLVHPQVWSSSFPPPLDINWKTKLQLGHE